METSIVTYVWLISLLWFILFLAQLRRGPLLTTEERVLAWLGIGLLAVSLIFQVIQWANITPTFLIPYASSVVLSFGFAFLALFAFLVGRRTKKIVGPTSLAAIPSAPEIEKELSYEFCARREVPDVDTLLKDAKENGQVWVMGIDCSHWLTGFPEKIRELVRVRNLSFTFLLAAEGTQSIQLAEGAKLISPQSDVTHSRSVESFNSIRGGLGNDAHKLRLGIYDLPPVHSMVVVNANTEDEQIVVDHYLYNIDPLERPSLVLKRARLSNQLRVVFDQYRKSMDHAMRNAKDQEGKPLLQ